MRVTITGIAGFAGSHLADHLLCSNGPDVHGIVNPGRPTPNIAHLRHRLTLHPADMTDYPSVRRALEAARPERIYHLAARASVAEAWQEPERTLVDNLVMQLNLLRAVVDLGLTPRVLVVGSADEYGLVSPKELPVSEATALRPLNPYAVSKIAQDYLGAQYHLGRGVHVVRVRPFNHLGPRQSTGYVAPDFASQIARIEARLAEPVIRVGNLSARRDFTDVRDMVCAYQLALEHGQPGAVYNIGSARSYAIQEILDGLLAHSDVPVLVEQDPARMRPSDTPEVVCDCRLFHAATGWQPRRTLADSLRDVLNEWRAIVHQESAGSH